MAKLPNSQPTCKRAGCVYVPIRPIPMRFVHLLLQQAMRRQPYNYKVHFDHCTSAHDVRHSASWHGARDAGRRRAGQEAQTAEGKHVPPSCLGRPRIRPMPICFRAVPTRISYKKKTTRVQAWQKVHLQLAPPLQPPRLWAEATYPRKKTKSTHYNQLFFTTYAPSKFEAMHLEAKLRANVVLRAVPIQTLLWSLILLFIVFC